MVVSGRSRTIPVLATVDVKTIVVARASSHESMICPMAHISGISDDEREE
jgi:hypothetical protein